MPHQLLAEHKMLQDGNNSDTVNIGKELFWSNRCQTSDTNLSLDARFNGIDFGPIAIVYLTFGAHITIEPSQTDEFFIIQTTLEGSSTTWNGDFQVTTACNDIVIIDPLQATRIAFTPGCAHLVLRIKRQLIESTLQSQLNQKLHDTIRFDHLLVENEEGRKSWIDTMNYLCKFYEKPYSAGLTPKTVVNSHIELVTNTLLSIQKHNYFDLQNIDDTISRPRHIRRACDYIEKNIREKITLDKICHAVGVSQRTLQNGFKKYLGQSPSEFIRNRRLHYIHVALSESDGKTNVSRIMWEFGVNNPGLWAKLYKERYGCLPSESIRR